MRSKQLLLPAVAMLWLLMGGCKKDNVAPNVSLPDISSNLSLAKAVPAVNAVPLGTAGNFVILSTTGISDVPTSAITGDIGSSPITGAAIGVPCTEVTGTIYEDDAGYTVGTCTNVKTDASRLTTAVGDMGTAYTNAAGRATSLPYATYLNLGGGTIGASTPPLAPGVYTWTSALSITGNITLKGGSNAVWIFQVNGTLDMASAASIILSGGAQASNIFWQVTGAVTLGTTSHFEGIILTAPSSYIAMQTGASINGRLLAGTAVTLQSNAVTQPPVTKGKK